MNKMYKKWRGLISYHKRLEEGGVVCVFADGWSAAPTANHTHAVNFFHFSREQKLTSQMFPLIQQFFEKCEELDRFMKNMDLSSGSWQTMRKIENKIKEIRNKIVGV